MSNEESKFDFLATPLSGALFLFPPLNEFIESAYKDFTFYNQ